MKELDNKLATNLFYCETCNRLFKPAFVENFINEYSSWDRVKAIKGSFLDDYFVPVKNENDYGVAFLEAPQDWNMNYYIVHVYDTASMFKKGYKQRYIERLEKVVNKEEGEKSAIKYIVGLLDGGMKPLELEDELYNLNYYDDNDNDCLYLRWVELKEGDFKGLVMKALDKYINILRDRAEEDKKIIVNAQYDFEMSDFLDSFNKYYEKLYDGKITREKALKALDYFDESMTDKQKKLLDNFSIYRQDFIASDRECEAFVLTLDKFNYGFYTAFKG